LKAAASGHGLQSGAGIVVRQIALVYAVKMKMQSASERGGSQTHEPEATA
jgi:hypothetical protein